MNLYSDYIKRGLDCVVSGVALVLLIIPLTVVTIWLHFANKGAGAFFLHERGGRNGKTFKVVKFKTMTDERDEKGELLPDKYRLTKVGRFVRSTSLDELPQLWNVFKGDMALIGPRPLYTWFLPLYDDNQSRRHTVRPGITGWAQVNGRNTMLYSKKFEHDVWYVDNVSMMLDIKILIKTIVNVFAAKDINSGVDDDEVDDLGWQYRQKEAEELYAKFYKNQSK